MAVLTCACRICLGNCTPFFEKKQLDRYNVEYFLCQECGSCQTEEPYWLQETYEQLTFALDTGMVSRTQWATRLALSLALEARLDRDDLCLDLGGGTGLFTRILRDCGLNAKWSDKYADNVFALGFEGELQEELALVTAFEVLEHLPNPREWISEVLKASPRYFLCSTVLYRGQDASWWYFLEDGQHIQFYTETALAKIAASFNYSFASDSHHLHLFSKDPLPKNFLKRVEKNASNAEELATKRFGSRTESDHWFHRSKSTPTQQ